MASTDHEQDYADGGHVTGPQPARRDHQGSDIVEVKPITGSQDVQPKPTDTMFSPVLREFFAALIEQHTTHLEVNTRVMQAVADQYRTAEAAARWHQSEIDRLTAEYHNA